MTAVSVALVHYPVVNKNGEVIGSAVTNLDLHDIARAARTFGVDRYYVTTPYDDQQQLVREIVDHWQTGYGAGYNPARKDALAIVRIAATLDMAIADLTARYGKRPLVVTTSARMHQKTLAYENLRKDIASGTPVLLVFGTAHGLAAEVMEAADAVLPPINGSAGYNHLSVRSAVSIILDRLLGS